MAAKAYNTRDHRYYASNDRYYGPQIREIFSALSHLDNPGNQDAAEVIEAASASQDHNLDNSACEAATAAFRSTSRNNPNWELSLSNVAVYALLRRALTTLTIKDRVGTRAIDTWGQRLYFNKKQYDYLTKPLQDFLTVTNVTPPGSHQRTLACDLIRNGASIKEALQATTLALII